MGIDKKAPTPKSPPPAKSRREYGFEEKTVIDHRLQRALAAGVRPEELDDEEPEAEPADELGEAEEEMEAEAEEELDEPEEMEAEPDDEELAEDGEEQEADEEFAEDEEVDDEEEDDTPASAAAAPPRRQKLGPSGRPLDRFGVEWDYVTSEGMGFNDDQDDDEMTVEKNGKTYFKPDWGEWTCDDWVEYWKRSFALEEAQGKGPKAFAAALRKFGLRNSNHWKRVQSTFLRHYGDDPEFTNAALKARQAGSRAMMKEALEPGSLDPIEGVSLETYATIQGRRSRLPATGNGFAALLLEYGLDEAKWARVDAGWMARMSGGSDPMAAVAVATEYGKYFAAGQSQSPQAAKPGAGKPAPGKPVAARPAAKKGGEPCTFERFVEIMTAQSCWAEQGNDVNLMFKKVFNITATDYSSYAAYWSPKLGTDVKMVTQFTALQEKYRQRYAAPDDPDSDLDV